MAIEFEVQEEIDRPVEGVFEYVSTVENEPEWHPAITESTQIDDEMAEGARWKETYDTPFGITELHEECIAFESPNRFGYETTNGLFGGRVRTTESIFHFSEDDAGTRVTISGETQVQGVLRLLEPVFGRMVRSDLEDQLAELKSTLEESAEDRPD